MTNKFYVVHSRQLEKFHFLLVAFYDMQGMRSEFILVWNSPELTQGC